MQSLISTTHELFHACIGHLVWGHILALIVNTISTCQKTTHFGLLLIKFSIIVHCSTLWWVGGHPTIVDVIREIEKPGGTSQLLAATARRRDHQISCFLVFFNFVSQTACSVRKKNHAGYVSQLLAVSASRRDHQFSGCFCRRTFDGCCVLDVAS